MRRLLAIAALLAGGTACLPLDFLVIPAYHTDGYDLSSDVIPESAIELVRFPTTDGLELTGVWVRQPGPRDEPLPVMIAFHGNGGPFDNGEWQRIETFYGWGTYDIFTFDYRGYGTSDGEPSRDGILEEDGLAAVQYVVDTTGLAPEDIPWVALSLGAAVASHTSDEIAARAIVLESLFASTDRLADEAGDIDLPTGWFFADVYDNVQAVEGLTAPVFLIHGTSDDFINPEHVLELYDAAPDPKWLWRPEGVGHADITRVEPEAYGQRVQAFLANPTVDPNPAADAADGAQTAE
ncbi:MAG: alpha/beta hydrolase [Alphaproteobacteria bacterium]|nr:alpha/beta hydrolase [Alphaproteobacteria bacterium]